MFDFREVEELDENGIFEMTGCISSCTKDEFEIAEKSELIRLTDKSKVGRTSVSSSGNVENAAEGETDTNATQPVFDVGEIVLPNLMLPAPNPPNDKVPVHSAPNEKFPAPNAPNDNIPVHSAPNEKFPAPDTPDDDGLLDYDPIELPILMYPPPSPVTYATITIAETFTDCGGVFETVADTLTSPLYPAEYPSNAECIYEITLPDENCISMTLLDVDIEYESSCGYDSLTILDGDSEDSAVMDIICGDDTNQTCFPISFTSTSNHLWIK